MAPTPRHRAVAVVALAAALTLGGCLRPREMGPSVPWARSHLVPRRSASPATVTSTYEHTPALEWRRFAMGQAYSPAFTLFGPPGPTACWRALTGATALPASGAGLPTRDLRSTGPSGTGVAGLPVLSAAQLLLWSHEDIPETLVSSAAGLSSGAAGCSTNVFAYVRLGLGSSVDPVTVLR